MRLLTCSVVLVAVWWAPAASAQAPGARQTPDFRVEIWGDAVADFSTRMVAYASLRKTLEEGLQPLAVTANPAEILAAENALALRIRRARAGARRGDIFSRSIRDAFKRALAGVVDPGICESIRDDNPGEFFYDINATYPKKEPHSTVPPSILGALPRLPDDVMYRFLDRDLILHDTRANVILDRIENAIKCK